MAFLIGGSWRDDLTNVLDGITELQSSHPRDATLLSASRQLTYLLALTDGHENDDAALEEINLGYLAMYQLADISLADLAELLSRINDRVRRYLRQRGRRLRIDP